MSVININNNNFQDEVMHSEKLVLLDFWASWCGPCRMVSPIVDEIAAERSDIKVCKINVDSDLRLAMTAKIRKHLVEHPDHFDPRQYLGDGRTAIKEMVAHKIKDVMGSDGQA